MTDIKAEDEAIRRYLARIPDNRPSPGMGGAAWDKRLDFERRDKPEAEK